MPFGFGGTKDRSDESPLSPRNVMNSFYLKPPFRVSAQREEELVSAVLAMRVGKGFYPGGLQPSPNWPGVAPGEDGINNAMAPGYCDLSAFADITPRPPVLWVRGADDQIVSDLSLLDFGHSRSAGRGAALAGRRGVPAAADALPDAGRAGALRGRYGELSITDSGHSPHLEQPEIFASALRAFLRQAP